MIGVIRLIVQNILNIVIFYRTRLHSDLDEIQLQLIQSNVTMITELCFDRHHFNNKWLLRIRRQTVNIREHTLIEDCLFSFSGSEYPPSVQFCCLHFRYIDNHQ